MISSMEKMNMARDKKQTKKFVISVEGDNSEKLYFQHLQKLINNYDHKIFNVNFMIKKCSPSSMVKRIGYKGSDKYNKNKTIPYFHIQDIEDYNDPEQKIKFEKLINEIKDQSISYKLGYSNYTFELWMLLHVSQMKGSVSHRRSYLSHINKYFNRNYNSLNEYKREEEFQKILDEYITLDSVVLAIKHAEEIRSWHENNNDKLVQYRGFQFYPNNPDTTIDEIIKIIFEACELSFQ